MTSAECIFNGQPCDTAPSSPIIDINEIIINNPLSCGAAGGLYFKCTADAIKYATGATITFTTNKDNVIAPFICTEEPGG